MIVVTGWPIWALLGLFVVGLVFIVKGGDMFVDAATWIAEVSGIPHFIIGATIVSVATTLPELIVSCLGAARGTNALAIGNAVGSVTANTGLIMAIVILFMPGFVQRRQYAFKSVLLILATSVLFAASFGERFSPWGAIVLLLIFVVATAESIRDTQKAAADEEKPILRKKQIVTNAISFLLGAVGIVIGADMLVGTATELATVSGVPESVISATIVAIGTSLPELVTSITAIVKKQASLSVGNIIGANLIDISIILPICSLIEPNGLTACAQNLWLDFPICLTLLIVAIIPMLKTGRFSRIQGGLMLGLYSAYLAIMTFFNPFH